MTRRLCTYAILALLVAAGCKPKDDYTRYTSRTHGFSVIMPVRVQQEKKILDTKIGRVKRGRFSSESRRVAYDVSVWAAMYPRTHPLRSDLFDYVFAQAEKTGTVQDRGRRNVGEFRARFVRTRLKNGMLEDHAVLQIGERVYLLQTQSRHQSDLDGPYVQQFFASFEYAELKKPGRAGKEDQGEEMEPFKKEPAEEEEKPQEPDYSTFIYANDEQEFTVRMPQSHHGVRMQKQETPTPHGVREVMIHSAEADGLLLMVMVIDDYRNDASSDRKQLNDFVKLLKSNMDIFKDEKIKIQKRPAHALRYRTDRDGQRVFGAMRCVIAGGRLYQIHAAAGDPNIYLWPEAVKFLESFKFTGDKN